MASGPREWVRAATLAPSTHNTQPWKFAIGDGAIQLYADMKRTLPVADPHKREFHISLGCALENLCLAAQADGFTADVALFTDDLRYSVARVEFTPDAMSPSPLIEAISRRQTNRRPFDRRPLDEEVIHGLDAVQLEPGISVQLITARDRFSPFAYFVEEATRRLMSNPKYVDELLEWIRFNPKEVKRTYDGVAISTFDKPFGSRWIGEHYFRRAMRPDAHAADEAELIKSASALLVISSESDDRCAWLAAGRTLERLALTATKLGLQHAYANQPCEVEEIRVQVPSRLSPEANYPQILLRLGYAPPAAKSMRRPLEDVLIDAEFAGERRPAPVRDQEEVPFYP